MKDIDYSVCRLKELDSPYGFVIQSLSRSVVEKVVDVVIGKRAGLRLHGWMRSRSRAVGHQRRLEILDVLSAQPGHTERGVGVALTLDAMATQARITQLAASLGITLS